MDLLSSLPAMQPKVYFNVICRFWIKCFALIFGSSFPVINSVWNRISCLLVLLPILCFLSRFNWSKSPLLSLMGLYFIPLIYTCQHLIQHYLFSSSSYPLPLHFLSIAILSSESPSRVCPIHFGFVVCNIRLIYLLFCGSTYWRVQEVWPHIPLGLYAGCVALASIFTAHLLQDRVLGVAVLVWLGALLSVRALPPSLLMCRPSYTPVLCSR